MDKKSSFIASAIALIFALLLFVGAKRHIEPLNEENTAKAFVFCVGMAFFFLIMPFAKGRDLQKERSDALAGVATRLKLSFCRDQDENLIKRFSAIGQFRLGYNRYAYNVFSGDHVGFAVRIFDFFYEVPGTANRGNADQRNYSAWLLETKTNFPELCIRQETLRSKIAEELTRDDIHFESTEFSKTFCVRSKDRKFAYDICHPRMMEYLLANRDLHLEFAGSALVIITETWLRPEGLEANLSRLIEVRKLLPNYLFNEA